MRTALLLATLALAACGPEEVPHEEPNFLGSWVGSSLVNVDQTRPGDDEIEGGRMKLSSPDEEPTEENEFDLYQWKGKITVELAYLATQVDIDGTPKYDDDNAPLYEVVGTVRYAGTWTAESHRLDEGDQAFDFDASCEEVVLDSTRKDLVSVCGEAGAPPGITGSCTRQENASTLECVGSFYKTDIVFSRD